MKKDVKQQKIGWGTLARHVQKHKRRNATNRDRTDGLQIFSLTLSHLSYCGYIFTILLVNSLTIITLLHFYPHYNSHHAYITTIISLTDPRRALQSSPYAPIQFYYFVFSISIAFGTTLFTQELNLHNVSGAKRTIPSNELYFCM